MKTFFAFSLILYFLAGCANTSSNLGTSNKNCQHTDREFRCVKYIKNYDGDSVTFFVPNVHPYFSKNFKVRLAGIDTPEIRGVKPCEKNLARTAKRLVQNQLSNAKNITLIMSEKKDKYGRFLASILYDEKDLGEILVKNNLAIKYYGDRKSHSWCQ